jgi:hypothetical protein
MPRLALVLSAVLSLPSTSHAEPPRAGGRIVSDEARVEILGTPVRVGERIDLPEGWIRVEEKGTEDERVGSFSIVPAESFGGVAAPVEGDLALAGDPAPRIQTGPDCTAERSAYLAELWRMSGIEVSSPAALIEGLEAGAAGPGTGYYWFALATDPFRPLAWSSSLRARAEALARCMADGS